MPLPPEKQIPMSYTSSDGDSHLVFQFVEVYPRIIWDELVKICEIISRICFSDGNYH